MKAVTIFMCIALLVLGVFTRIMFNELDQMNKTLDGIKIEVEQMKKDLSELRMLAAETKKMADELRMESLELKKTLEPNKAAETGRKNNDEDLIGSLRPGESVRLSDDSLAYKVKSGDCLSRLTERFTGCGRRPCWEKEWHRLRTDNPDFTDPHLIYPGQVLIFGKSMQN